MLASIGWRYSLPEGKKIEWVHEVRQVPARQINTPVHLFNNTNLCLSAVSAGCYLIDAGIDESIAENSAG